MRDTELYRHLLDIQEPWRVERVELQVDEKRVDVWVDHDKGVQWPCPECGELLAAYDHAPERSWRHLDSCQFMTYLRARPPRINCPHDGVRQVRLPWAEPHSRFTLLFERLAIDVLLETNVLGAARLLRLSWDQAWHLMERAVERGLRRKAKRVVRLIGVDEKAAAKGHRYLTLVCDLEHNTIEYVSEHRRAESLDSYFAELTPEQLLGIEAIATDMWDPYLKSIRTHVPDADAKIVFDRFHVMRHLTWAVDTVRKREHRELRAAGDDTLLRSKYLWLYSYENLPEHHLQRFNVLRTIDLKTSRAWAIKESLRHLWGYRRRGWAERHWKRWYFWATHSRLKPMIAAARTLHRHIGNILTYFKHRITTSTCEGINSVIQTVKQMACGFRNLQHFRAAIFFHCGGLELYPLLSPTHKEPG
jgi:transposase